MHVRTLVLCLACLALPATAVAQQYQPVPQQQPPPPAQPMQPTGEQPPDQSWMQSQNPQPTPPPQPPTPPPTEAQDEAVEDSGFLLRARIASSYPLGYAPHAGPDVVIGTILGSVELHAGLAITTLGTSEEFEDEGDELTSETTVFALVLSPGFSYTMFRSADRKAHSYLSLNALIGTLNISGDDEMDDDSAILYGGYLAFGGEYRVHSSFGTGLEAGYGAVFGSDSEGASNVTASMTGFFAALVATLYLGG